MHQQITEMSQEFPCHEAERFERAQGVEKVFEVGPRNAWTFGLRVSRNGAVLWESHRNPHAYLGRMREMLFTGRPFTAAEMDAIGFGLENYDAIGAFRSQDAGAAIDPSGELSVAEKFQGPVDLAKLLATKKQEDYVRCLVEKLLTYSLGRGLEYYDRPAVKSIADGLAKRRHTFSGLVLEVVNSVPFQKRAALDDTRVASNTATSSVNSAQGSR